MRKHTKKAMTLLMTAILLAGCAQNPSEPSISEFNVNFVPSPINQAAIAIENPYQFTSNNIIPDVDIWLDGTTSMQGFLPSGDRLTTAYTATLPVLEDTAYALGANSVRKFRYDIGFPRDDSDFIDIITKLDITEDEAIYEMMALPESANLRVYESPSFYQKNKYYNEKLQVRDASTYYLDKEEQKSNPKRYELRVLAQKLSKKPYHDQPIPPLTFALQNINPKRLSVVVTDMYVEKGLMQMVLGELVGLLARNDDFTLSLIGVQSDFAGKIFDIGESDLDITYGSVNEPRKHPFFFLVIGKNSDVKSYAAKLVSTLEGRLAEPEVEIHYFTDTNQWESISDLFAIQFEEGSIAGADGKYHVSLGKWTEPPKFGTESVKPPINLQATMAYTFSVYSPYDLSPKFEASTIAVSALAVQRHDLNYKKLAAYSDEIDTNRNKFKWYLVEKNIEIPTFWSHDGSIDKIDLGNGIIQYTIKTDLSISLPAEKGIYYLSGRPSLMIPNEDFDYKMSDWIYDWSIDIYQPEEWSQDISSFPGDRVLYLRDNMQTILEMLNRNKRIPQTMVTIPEFLLEIQADYD